MDGTAVHRHREWAFNNGMVDFPVWAYDADGDSSSPTQQTESTGKRTAAGSRCPFTRAGRLVLRGAVRGYEGVSLRDMWLKAQRHPMKQWICLVKQDVEWDHEPFV